MNVNLFAATKHYNSKFEQPEVSSLFQFIHPLMISELLDNVLIFDCIRSKNTTILFQYWRSLFVYLRA